MRNNNANHERETTMASIYDYNTWDELTDGLQAGDEAVRQLDRSPLIARSQWYWTTTGYI